MRPLDISFPPTGRFDGGGMPGAAAIGIGAVGTSALWTLVAYQAGPLLAAVLPLGLALLAVIAVRPMTGVYLAVLCVPLEQLGFASVGADVTPAKGLLFVSGIVMAAHLLLGTRRANPHPAHLAFGALLLVGVLGLSATDDAGVTAKILAQWAAYLATSMYVATADRKQLMRLLGCVVLAGGIVGISAVLTTGDQQLVAGGQAATGRAEAGFSHPATLSFFLVLAFPPALALGFRGPKLARLPAFAAAGLCIAGILLSLTRGAILGAVVAMLVLLFWAEFRRLAVVLLAVILVFAAFNLKAIQQSPEAKVIGERIQSITDTQPTADNARTKIWAKTPAIIADHPFIGVGAGNFSTASGRYNIIDLYGETFVHAHDIALTVAAEFGLFGLALFVLFAGLLGADVVRFIARNRGSPSYPPALSLAAALAGLFVVGITDYPPSTLVIMGVIMIEVGALVGYVRVLDAEREDRETELRPLARTGGGAPRSA